MSVASPVLPVDPDLAGRFESLLGNIARLVCELRVLHRASKPLGNMAEIRYAPEEWDSIQVEVDGVCPSNELSAHGQLTNLRLYEELSASLKGFISALIETSPILDMPCLQIGMAIADGKLLGPSYSLWINGLPITAGANPESLGKALAERLALASGLPAGLRSFQVEQTRIMALCAEDAYRLYLSLISPAALKGTRRRGVQVRIHEILDAQSIHDSVCAN